MKKITLVAIVILSFYIAQCQQNSIIKWTFQTNGKNFSNPIIDDNLVYFGSNDSTFYAVGTNSGNLAWSIKTNSIIQSEALIKNDIVYFKSGNDFFALNKDNGTEVWSFKGNTPKVNAQIDYWDYNSGVPAIDNENIYVGFEDGNLYGFDMNSGEIKFHFMAKGSAAIKSGLLIENSVLYFGDWNGKTYAYDLEKNKLLWIYKTYEEQLYPTFGQLNTNFAINGDLLFFGARNPEMQVINKTTGVKAWSYTDTIGSWISGSPEILNDTLFIGGSDNHKMFAFNANTGEKFWFYTFLNNNFTKPLIYKNYVIFTTGDAYNVYGTSPGRGYLYALNRKDGSIKNFEYIGGNIYSSLILKDGILYFGSSDKKFYTVELDKFLNNDVSLEEKGYNSVDILEVSPNPLIETSQIKYKVYYQTPVNIQVTDLNEHKVIKLFSGTMEMGEYVTSWDGKDMNGNKVQPGYYFIEISSKDFYKKKLIQIQNKEKSTN